MKHPVGGETDSRAEGEGGWRSLRSRRTRRRRREGQEQEEGEGANKENKKRRKGRTDPSPIREHIWNRKCL